MTTKKSKLAKLSDSELESLRREVIEELNKRRDPSSSFSNELIEKLDKLIEDLDEMDVPIIIKSLADVNVHFGVNLPSGDVFLDWVESFDEFEGADEHPTVLKKMAELQNQYDEIKNQIVDLAKEHKVSKEKLWDYINKRR